VRFYELVCRKWKLTARRLTQSLAVVVVFGVLGGCGGGGGDKILYAVGLGSPTVAVFSVSSSGALTARSPVTTGAAPSAIVIDPLLRFAYVIDSGGGVGPGGVSQYVLTRSSGALVVATLPAANGNNSPSTPIETGVGPAGMAIDGTGAFAFVVNTGAIPANPGCSPTPSVCVPSISVYTVDSVGGALTEVKQPTTNPPAFNCTANEPIPCPLPVVPSSAIPKAVVTSGNMVFVALANAGAGSVATYTFDSSGKLTGPTSTTAAGTNPSAMTMDSSGKILFVADSATNTVATFSIGSSGQISAVGAPVPVGTTPISVQVNPRGNFLYTANRDSSNISGFSFDSTGTLTALSGSPFASANSPTCVTFDSSGALLFVANGGTNSVSVFSVDTSGGLKQASTSSFVVVSPVALASIN